MSFVVALCKVMSWSAAAMARYASLCIAFSCLDVRAGGSWDVALLWVLNFVCTGTGGVGTDSCFWRGRGHQKKNSIAFGKSTSQRIYREQHTPQIGWKLHKYRLKHALHTLDDHFR